MSYSSDSGTGYKDRNTWFPHFCAIADRIIADFHPKTVLDAGCAYGYLVEALRDRGVEAYGVDISEYAISQVAEHIKPYCYQRSLTEPLTGAKPEYFDLITNIGVVEHLNEDDGKAVLANLCAHTDTVLFFSSSIDSGDPTNINVQQSEYWASRFAHLSFYRQMNYAPDYVSKDAVCYKRGDDIVSVVEAYERYCRQIDFDNKYWAYIYLDTGKGYSEDEKYEFAYEKDAPATIRINAEGTKSVRLIPSVSMACVVRDVELIMQSGLCAVHDTNGLALNGLYFFPTETPYFDFDLSTSDTRYLEIHVQIVPVHDTVILSTFIHMQEKLASLDGELDTVCQRSDQLRLELYQQYEQQLSALQQENKALKDEIHDLETDKAEIEELLLDERNYADSLCDENQDRSNLIEQERAQHGKAIDVLKTEHDQFERTYNDTVHTFWWHLIKPGYMFTVFAKKVIRKIYRNVLTRGIKRVILSLHHNGLRITLMKIAIKLSGKKLSHAEIQATLSHLATKKNVPQNLAIRELYRDTENPVFAIPTIITNEKVKRLNLDTDSIEQNSLLGGVATALIVASCFAQKNGYELRIITRNAPVNPANYENILKMSGITPPCRVSYYSDYDRDSNYDKDYRLDITEDDIFFATSWWSAVAIQRTSLRKRFFYIVQEVETFFYNHGGEHFLCNQIMQNENIDFIINSHYLYEYFQGHESFMIRQGVFFEPAFPLSIYKAKSFTKKDKYRLFFYARPNNPRNMFNYGIQMLDAAIAHGIIDTRVWEICCAGQPVGRIKFSNGYIAKDMGQMTWQAYAEFLQDVDLALCLMYTPHPSYPPYDVACSGGIVITNVFMNKKEFPQSNNVIMSELPEEKFLEAMQNAISLAKDPDIRKMNYENSIIPREWGKSLEDTIRFMEERL